MSDFGPFGGDAYGPQDSVTRPGLAGPGGMGDPTAPGGFPPGFPPGYQGGYPYQGAYPYLPGYGPQPGTNGMSIAALVCGICGFIYGVPGVLGIVFGFVGLSQIKRTGQQGRGMAIAGIVCGIAWIVLFVVLVIALIAFVNTVSTNISQNPTPY